MGCEYESFLRGRARSWAGKRERFEKEKVVAACLGWGSGVYDEGLERFGG